LGIVPHAAGPPGHDTLTVPIGQANQRASHEPGPADRAVLSGDRSVVPRDAFPFSPDHAIAIPRRPVETFL